MLTDTPIAFLRDHFNAVRSYIHDLRLLVLLLLTDLVFIVLHIFHKFTTLLPDMMYNIELDHGYGEMLQYIKEFWIILLLLELAFRRRKVLYFAWSLLFSYLLLDDMFQLHEFIGGTIIKPFLVETFGRQSRFGVSFKDYGELLVSAIAGSSLLFFVAISHLQIDNKGKIASVMLFMLLCLLAFFGIAVDMLHEHIWVRRSEFLNWDVFGMIEDSGEMIIMSAIAWFVYNIHYTFCRQSLTDVS
jgi:hypothetical protein